MKVLQWNVWYKENIERVIGVLKAQDADVICLQELTRGYIEQSRENTWEYIAHELGYAYRVQEIPIITAETQWSQANAVFSRWPILHRQAVWLHEPAELENPDDQYRGYLEVVIDAGGTEVTVATTHLSFKTTLDTNPEDDAELANLLPRITAKRSGFILTGDLNAVPDSRRVRAISAHLRHAGPSYEQKTWTTKPFTFKDLEAKSLDWRYDYVFASPDLAVQDARIVQTDVSDHLPVMVTFALPVG